MYGNDAPARRILWKMLGAAIASWGCSGDALSPADDVGSGGVSSGGATGSGGAPGVAGSGPGGGSSSGGSTSAAGSPSGAAGVAVGTGSSGATGSGGNPGVSGGASGASAGGRSNAGGANGGNGGSGMSGAGGRGGTSAGPGGSANGGASAGGASGGGGSGSCDFSAPPADVADWIDQSWAGQLGNNVRSRKDWNLDHVMIDKGEMSLCVRWGATSAVPDTVRMNLAATIERWFNDWWKGLGSYGCFPYGNGVKVKITGWAVRPGKESLLGGISGVPIYTETDSDGEPKCPDNCSAFVHWDHQFPNCPGGAANHTDYWLWFDDTLPGGGGAAAVGGDWGLRMPVGTFTGAFNNPSYLVVEHEMGHGFGFQDYYDWTGATPAGGSIMIVGSTRGSQAPTTGDIWLLRRTWKEMKTLRNW
jgi:hypothetical protein